MRIGSIQVVHSVARSKTPALRLFLSLWVVLGLVFTVPAISDAKKRKKSEKDKKAQTVEAQDSQSPVVQTDTAWFGKEPLLTLPFPRGKKRFSKRMRKKLKKLAQRLNKDPALTDITIVGHSDNQGKEKVRDNLSKARARFVEGLLRKLGLDTAKINVKVVGAADQMPVAGNKKPKGRKANRRTNIFSGVIYLGPDFDDAPPPPVVVPKPEPPKSTESVAEPPSPTVVAGAPVEDSAEALKKEEKVSSGKSVVADVSTDKKKKKKRKKRKKRKKLAQLDPLKSQFDDLTFLEKMGSGSYWWEQREWVSAGMTGVLLTSWIAVGVSALSGASDLDQMVRGTTEFNDKKEQLTGLAGTANTLMVASLLSGAITTKFFLEDLFKTDTKPVKGKVGVVPTASGFSLQFGMTFP